MVKDMRNYNFFYSYKICYIFEITVTLRAKKKLLNGLIYTRMLKPEKVSRIHTSVVIYL